MLMSFYYNMLFFATFQKHKEVSAMKKFLVQWIIPSAAIGYLFIIVGQVMIHHDMATKPLWHFTIGGFALGMQIIAAHKLTTNWRKPPADIHPDIFIVLGGIVVLSLLAGVIGFVWYRYPLAPAIMSVSVVISLVLTAYMEIGHARHG